MDVMPILPETEVEATAALHLGRLLFVFGRMELDLGMALVRAEQDTGAAAARVARLGFSEKLGELEALVLPRHADDAQLLARWRRWFRAAQGLRKLRRDFGHGRWGFQNMQQQLVHASALPGGPEQDEVRYTLAGFAARVAEAEDVAEEFCALLAHDPLGPCHRAVTKAP